MLQVNLEKENNAESLILKMKPFGTVTGKPLLVKKPTVTDHGTIATGIPRKRIHAVTGILLMISYIAENTLTTNIKTTVITETQLEHITNAIGITWDVLR